MKKIHSFDEVFDGQRVFRKVLESMSNPGRILNIKEEADKMYGENKPFLALAMTLIDNEVSYYTCGNESLAKDISLLTLSRETDLAEADFIFVERESDLKNVIEHAKTGTLADPQKSAAIILKVPADNDVEISIRGAGIKGTLSISVPQIVFSALELRKQQEHEYPTGIDFIFVTDEGELYSIPRLVLKEDM